jgi:hypothetical protein
MKDCPRRRGYVGNVSELLGVHLLNASMAVSPHPFAALV